MRNILIIICLLSALTACKKEPTLKSLNGTYKGTFSRVSVSRTPSNVTLNFSDDTWSGESSEIKYPALCNGTFELNGNKVTFKNNCVWTAEFDWTLILNGEYSIKSTGNNSIEIVKSKNGVAQDVYKLVKQ
jgi:hypothetical protein